MLAKSRLFCETAASKWLHCQSKCTLKLPFKVFIKMPASPRKSGILFALFLLVKLWTVFDHRDSTVDSSSFWWSLENGVCKQRRIYTAWSFHVFHPWKLSASLIMYIEKGCQKYIYLYKIKRLKWTFAHMVSIQPEPTFYACHLVTQHSSCRGVVIKNYGNAPVCKALML